MPIFNSLGSNYDCRFQWLAIMQFFWPNKLQLEKLKNKLQTEFAAQVQLVWKGRDAIELALESYGVGSGDVVMTQAFCCYSIEEAVNRLQARIVYADLEKDEVKLSFKSFRQAADNHPDLKAVILQHVLGYVDEVGKIADYCRQNNILLIEDLAQSVGAEYAANQSVGQLADACVLSFGRDKIVDGISGGAVVYNTPPQHKIKNPFALDGAQPKKTKKKQQVIAKDLFYPVLTAVIRTTYRLGIGKALHSLAKKSKWLYSPVKSFHQSYQSLPAYYAPLILYSWENLEDNIKHRRKISHYYLNQLQSLDRVSIPLNREQISRSTNLRFPILVSDPENLIQFLKKKRFFLADRWYPEPVAAGKLDIKSSYESGSCPNAEELAAKIVNLPTHHLVDIKQAQKITSAVKEWAQGA